MKIWLKIKGFDDMVCDKWFEWVQFKVLAYL